jgi:hypothetical protein
MQRNQPARIEPLEARIAPAIIFAVTETQRLISFDSAAPQTLLSDVAITGLTNAGTERMEAIDFRPATWQLYGLGINDFDNGADEAALYTIDPATGVASNVVFNGTLTLIGHDFADDAHYGFDFDPVRDVIRVVNTADQNVRVNPATGFGTADTALDLPTSGAEAVYGAAYDRSVVGATATTLYALDFGGDQLVRIGGVDGAPSANGGALTAVGSLGFAANSFLGGFDIAARSGTGFAAIFTSASGTDLYTINLATGAATVVGDIGSGTVQVRGLAVAPPSDLTIAAGGKSATFTDLDGDKVVVTTSAGALSAGQFTFGAVSALGRQLAGFKVAAANFADAALTFTATPVKGKGDGFVNIGRIDATGIDLGKVTVDGDLGQIDAGDGADDDLGLASLTVHSLGALGTSTQLPGGDLRSIIAGNLGGLTIKTDLLGARIEAKGVGKVFIGGDLGGGNDANIHAGIYAFGPMGDLTIGGSIVGGATFEDAAIFASFSLGKVTVGGSILGGAGASSGKIETLGPAGAVTIKGDLVGGTDAFSGAFLAGGNIASFTLGGSLLGGTVADPGNDQSAGFLKAGGSIPGGVKIGGDVRGGNGQEGGAIFVGGNLGAVTIGGALVGGAGALSGSIQAGSGSLGAVKIGGDVRSGTGNGSGGISSGGAFASLTVGGSLVQSAGAAQLTINVGTTLGPVKIGGDVRGSGIFLFPGVTVPGIVFRAFGVADTAAGFQSVTIGGSVTFGAILVGSSTDPDATLGPVKVGGDWVASQIVVGTRSGADGTFGTADDVKAAEAAPDALFSTIASVTIGGFVMGTVGGTDHYGFVAEKIGALTVGGVKVPLTAGLDKVGFALGVTGDVRVREVDATPAVFPADTLAPADNPLIYAVDQGNNLITFRADAPGAILKTVNITGLLAGENIVGMDFRPANGGLYALGVKDVGGNVSSGRLLRLDPALGIATAIGSSVELGALQSYGFDFDPVADRIRVVGSSNDANLRLNPDDGTTEFDTNVARGAGGNESIYAVAYDRNFIGGGASTLYGIDYSSSALVRIGDVDGAPGSPNGGVLTFVGNLAESSFLDDNTFGGFDIESRTGVGYAALFDADAPNPSQIELYTINLTTGRATLVGPIGTGAQKATEMRGFTVALPAPDFVGPTSGKTITYRDVDGDLVTVKSNKGTLDASMFTFAPGEFGSQLQRLNLSGGAFSGADITITATPFEGRGDGFVNVGQLSTNGLPIGKVTVDGDLGRINAIGIGSLTAHSMGRFGTSTQLPGGSLESTSVDRNIGAIKIKTDLVNASIAAVDGSTSIGTVTIGGSIVGGDAKTGLFAAGAIGNVALGGSLVGGSATDSGKINAGTTLGKVTLGGSLLGGTGASAGMIESSAGTMGAVKIKGEIAGGTQLHAGSILAKGTIASVTLGGSLVGGVETFTGAITADGSASDNLGSFKIGGSMLGGGGFYSGGLYADETIGAVSIAGSVVGGGEFASGSIFGVKGIASVKIGRDLRGGAGSGSGSIASSQGSIGAVAIGASLAGVDAANTGIFSESTLGKVTIGGSLRGDGPGGVRLQAKGLIDPASAAKAVAIAGLSVKGSVRGALILAGYDDFNLDIALNPDAGIGAVSIGSNFLASSLIAGTARGDDNVFGTADDEKVSEPTADAIFSRIASVTIRGSATGTPGVDGDHFGIVAERVGKVKVGSATYSLTEANRLTGLAVGPAGDLQLRGV